MFKTILKLLLIGLATTLVRIVGQLLIPAGEQSVLAPSHFVANGTMPLAFTIYGIVAYSLIASLFLLVGSDIPGTRVMQGIKYGLAFSLLWTVYLLEPLPHVARLDRVTYPLADSAALMVLGLLCGLFLGAGRTHPSETYTSGLSWRPVSLIAGAFVLGRLVQYHLLGIYSSYHSHPVESMAWCVLTGLVVGTILTWLGRYVKTPTQYGKALVVGLLLFGVNLLVFNFFMPLVFQADLPDLILRTVADVAAVTTGLLVSKGA